jgi:TolA-binding protein
MRWMIRWAAARSLLQMLIVIVLCGSLTASCRRDEARQIFDRGLAFWQAEKHDEAVQSLIALTKAFPEHPLVDDALFWIANIYEHYLNDNKQTVRYYLLLTSHYEDSQYYQRALIGLARVRSQEGEEGKLRAIRIYRKLQSQLTVTANETAWEKNQLRLAQLFMELEQYEQARAELKQLILKSQVADFVARAYYLIGRSYVMQGQPELAKIAFLDAERKFGLQKIALAAAFSLADIYEQSGELSTAVAIYESVLERLERSEVFYQLADDRIKKLKLRLRQTNTG